MSVERGAMVMVWGCGIWVNARWGVVSDCTKVWECLWVGRNHSILMVLYLEYLHNLQMFVDNNLINGVVFVEDIQRSVRPTCL